MKKLNLPLIHAKAVSLRRFPRFISLSDLSPGNAMLMVGVFGPKYPCEEVFIKHIGNNQYNVQYVRLNSSSKFSFSKMFSFRLSEKKVDTCWLSNGVINIFLVLHGILKLFKNKNNSNNESNAPTQKQNRTSPFSFFIYMHIC